MESAIPVTIIAGSFASGKTTFCNEVLGTFEKANVAVISHRFAEECPERHESWDLEAAAQYQ